MPQRYPVPGPRRQSRAEQGNARPCCSHGIRERKSAMKGLLAGVAIGALGLSLPVVSDAQTGKLSRQSEKFIKEAAGGGVGEVQLGQPAQSKASSPEVKQVAPRNVQGPTQ